MLEAKRALEAYKKMFSSNLNEDTGEQLRTQDLAGWNKKQYQLWTKAVGDGLFTRNDVSSFGKFGKFFYDYVDKTEQYPEYDDMLDWIDTEVE